MIAAMESRWIVMGGRGGAAVDLRGILAFSFGAMRGNASRRPRTGRRHRASVVVGSPVPERRNHDGERDPYSRREAGAGACLDWRCDPLFWVPQLQGKTDAITGRVNETWLQADHPGVYRGECAEFCGHEHAHMAFVVVAEAPGDYAAWLANEQRLAVGADGFSALAGTDAVSSTIVLVLSHDSRNTGAVRAWARPHAPRVAAHARFWYAGFQSREPGSLDRESRSHQAGNEDATGST